jgi:hypothetical protein
MRHFQSIRLLCAGPIGTLGTRLRNLLGGIFWCSIEAHDWKYTCGTFRRCECCGRQEVLSCSCVQRTAAGRSDWKVWEALR